MSSAPLKHTGPASIFHLPAEHAARRGDRPFLFCGEDVLTYGEMETAARRLAAGLEKLGVGPGDKVAILMGDAAGEGLGRNVVTYGDIAGSAPLAHTPQVQPSDPGAIIFTSGTTGPSKGVLLPQAYPLRLASIIQAACRYTEADKLYNALPLFHGNAQFLLTAPAPQPSPHF